MVRVILFLVSRVFLFHSYCRYIVSQHNVSVFIMLTVVKHITYSENGSTGKHAIGKKRVWSGNIGHLSKTFPSEPLRNIFKVSMS